MTRHQHLFDIGNLIQARLEFVQEARALPLGTERNQKRQIARSLKKLVENQTQARDQVLAASHSAGRLLVP